MIPKISFMHPYQEWNELVTLFKNNDHQTMFFKVLVDGVCEGYEYAIQEKYLEKDKIYEFSTHPMFRQIDAWAKKGYVEQASQEHINNIDEKYRHSFNTRDFNEYEKQFGNAYESLFTGIIIPKEYLAEIGLNKIEYLNNQKVVILDFFTDYLIFKYHPKTVGGDGKYAIYCYHEGIYEKNGDKKIVSDIENTFGTRCTNRLIYELLEKIYRKTYINQTHLVEEEGYICLENGILNIIKKTLSEHDPSMIFLSKMNVKYNPDVCCQNFFNLTKGMFKTADEHRTIQEWYGYTLTIGNREKKALILEGPKNTGKTTMINHYLRFFGEENNSGQSLQKICGHQFAIAELYGKKVNVCDDLQKIKLEDIGQFKVVTGDGPINGEFKFGHCFNFKNNAKLVFSCNIIPKADDADDAYFERWLPICMDNIIPLEKRDKNLAKKLYTENEMSGVLNYALSGLDRLNKQGHFSYQPSSIDVKSYMMRSGSSVMEFIFEFAENIGGAKIIKETLYRYYADYTNYMAQKTERWDKYKIVSKEKFGRELNRNLNYIGRGEKNKISCWKNITVKCRPTLLYGEKSKKEFELYPCDIAIDKGDIKSSINKYT